MATTLNPARPSPGADGYPLDAGHFDEAFAPTGTPRPPYAAVIDALAQHDLVELRERVRSNVDRARALTFGPGRPMAVDPVPRLIDAAEWETLEAGLRAAGAGAERLPRSTPTATSGSSTTGSCRGACSRPRRGTSRGCAACSTRRVPPATVAGLDLVRDADGELLVLEDNLRMPSGATYAIAVREAVGPALGAAPPSRCRSDGYVEALGDGDPRRRSRRRATSRSPRSSPTAPRAAPATSTERLGRELGAAGASRRRALASRARPPLRPHRPRAASSSTSSTAGSTRTGSATPAGALTPLGELLLPALESGRLRCVNAFGTGARRRQARPRLRRGDGPLLPRRGAAAALGRRASTSPTRPAARRRWRGSTSW